MSQDTLHIRNADKFACYSLVVAYASTVCAKLHHPACYSFYARFAENAKCQCENKTQCTLTL